MRNVVGYTPGKPIESDRGKQAAARAALVARRARAIVEAANDRRAAEVEAEQQARGDLEQHAADLALEIERARAAREPNPFITPESSDYVPPEEFRIRRQLEAEQAERALAARTARGHRQSASASRLTAAEKAEYEAMVRRHTTDVRGDQLAPGVWRHRPDCGPGCDRGLGDTARRS